MTHSSTVEIPIHGALANGASALIDSEYLDLVQSFRWTAIRAKSKYGGFYARTDKPFLAMHRLIMGVNDPNILVDHENHNGLDNRKENLRLITPKENMWNARPKIGGSSSYKGVTWHKHKRRWNARIYFNNKMIQLGYYKSEQDAGSAYDAAARELFGEYACLNFPDR